MELSNKNYKKITESLKLMSLSYQEQKAYFPDFVDVPFEVLDTFDNAFLLLPNLIESGSFNNEGIAFLIRLNNLIRVRANNPLFKNLDENQFSESQEWQELRNLSKETLRKLGEPIESPDSKYI